MFEKYGIWLLALGALSVFVGWIWLTYRAFKTRWTWGLGCLLFPPLCLLFAPLHWAKAARPAQLMILGATLIAATYGVSHLLANMVDLGKWEKRVDGEIHLTLTGWDRTDYAFLKKRRDIVVLQMANPDVTDEIVAQLEGSMMLKELDLNDTAITDASLPILASIPNLKILRLRGTKITDQGFREHLLGKESLLSVDLRETAVASKTLREWKKEKPADRQYLK